MKYIIILLLCLFIFIQFKQKEDNHINPTNLNNTHICANDYMIIINYSGPKAQIVWKNNSRSFYCDVKEIFYEVNDQIKNKIIKKIFVQDFSNVKWGSYTDKWIEAINAYYVVDSTKDGAMGVTYVPFSNINYANAFINEYGGKLLKFDQINYETLTLSNNILKERTKF